jgi:hypothetical protein
MQFLAESVKTRWGLRVAAQLAGLAADPTGVDILTVLGTAQVPTGQSSGNGNTRLSPAFQSLFKRGHPVPNYGGAIPANTQVGVVFTTTGQLLLELPAGSGNLIPIPGTRIAQSLITLLANLPSSAVMQTTKAYNRIYMAFTDLQKSLFPVLALDAATGFVSPVEQNPVAAVWQANTFYQQGDIVTPTANRSIWFRRTTTGYSGTTEPTWPTTLGYFVPGPSPVYAQAADGPVNDAWEEWTPGFPSVLPQVPAPITTGWVRGGSGAILANKDVYWALSYFNDLGETAWITGMVTTPNVAGLYTVYLEFDTASSNTSGPPMPRWLMSVLALGTTGGLHWPPEACLNVYVNAVTHGAAAPSQYYLYAQVIPAAPVDISSIPGAGTLYSPVTVPTAAITTQQFIGEPGTRYATVLRQDTMGNLSGFDPDAAIAVAFPGVITVGSVGVTTSTSGPTYYLNLYVDDVTQFSYGQPLTIAGCTVPSANGTYPIGAIILNQAYPAGILSVVVTQAIYNAVVAGLPVTCSVNVPAGNCPVAVVPPGSQEGPGYTYDIVALTVVGLDNTGPYNYLTNPEPALPASANILYESLDGNGNAVLSLSTAAGFAAGDAVLVAGYTGGALSLNGLKFLATVSSTLGYAGVTLYNPSAVGSWIAEGATISVIQTLPTLATPGTVGIQLQFDDTTLPEGVDVTDNALFIALPPATDLSYLPSVDRIACVSDQQPTTIIFSETTFLGEVDGENDVLSVEQTDGAVLAGVRELLNGVIVACKESGGYQIIPTADVPARWGVNRLWGNHGPWSGRNIATGRDAGSRMPYLIFVDPDSGVYRWPPVLGMGDVDHLSKELSGANNQDATRMATWDRVNRAAGQTIQVVIDDIAKEIKIAVPLDGATAPSHILTMSYFNGWQDPLMLTLSGEWVANRQSRRWNIDPIPTRCMALVKRTLATPVDQRVNRRQLLLGTLHGMNGGSLALTYTQPSTYDDLGAGILSRYRPAYAKEMPNQEFPGGGRMLRFSATTGHAIGQGNMTLTFITPHPEYDEPPLLQTLEEGGAEIPGSAPVTHFARGMKGDGEFLTTEFATDGKPGSWFQLTEYTAWYKALFPTR